MTATSRRLPEGHTAPLAAADLFMGSFCLFMVGVAAVGWWRGEVSWYTPVAILGYVAANFLCSRLITSRAANPARGELVRLAIMTVANPVVFLVTDGPLAGWWPGFLINALGQGIVVGLTTQRARWGTVITVYYLALYLATVALGNAVASWYLVALHGGVIAMVSLLWARVMSLLGVALHNERERTIELAAARDALTDELEVARQLQILLLPVAPRLPGFTVAGRMIAAAGVSGDYYDVFETSGRRLIAIGDVSGHGVTSGLAMMMARAGLLGALEANPTASLTATYQALNRSVHANLRRMGVDLYMTFALLELDERGVFHAVGRHLPLLVYRAASGRVDELDLAGTWLGVMEDIPAAQLPVHELVLAPGDVLLLYTDGLAEHVAGEGLDEDALEHLVRERASQGAVALLDALFANATPDPDDGDDMTALVIERPS